jgi:hypothetical protein
MHLPPTPNKKIRFAALLEPRAQMCANVWPDGVRKAGLRKRY